MPAGSLRYCAPFYLPERLQRHVPKALISDPWPSIEDRQLRNQHAQLLLSFLKQHTTRANQTSPRISLTAQQIFDRINSSPSSSASPSSSSVSSSPSGPVFGSPQYVKQLLEHLRTARLIRSAVDSRKQAAAVAAGPAASIPAAPGALAAADEAVSYFALEYQQVREPMSVGGRGRGNERERWSEGVFLWPHADVSPP
jgi:hypothetical protein